MDLTGERSFDAVLFDWCGTLVEYPTDRDRFRGVLQRLGRRADDASVAGVADAYEEAKRHPVAVEANERCDLSAEDHRAAKLLVCELAGIDRELAIEFERSLGDLSTYSTYPEVVDVVAALANGGVKMAIVSDFHVDLRPHIDSLGLLQHVSEVVLSCEVGATKPDAAMFEAALRVVGVEADRCLMVGDNPLPDTGAAALGIPTLILPCERPRRTRPLELVLPLVFATGP